MKIVFVLAFLAACGGKSTATADGGSTDADKDDMVEVSSVDLSGTTDLLFTPSVDMANANDLLQPADMAVMCVRTGDTCMSDAQCCMNQGAAGSCARTPNGLTILCCLPETHSCTAGDAWYRCCPGTHCQTGAFGQPNGTCRS